jgi:Predicted membrane protein (DUF2231)
MQPISRLEQDSRLDGLISAGQRIARLIKPGKVRDALHGRWLGHPLHPMLVQAPVRTWLSASVLDFTGGDEQAARRLVTTGLIAAVPAAVAGSVDWSEQHEQQMRIGVVHAAGNIGALGLYGASLLSRTPRLSRTLRLAGLATASASSLLGGHISFRLAGGVNHAEEVPHLVEPGWHHLMAAADLPVARQRVQDRRRFGGPRPGHRAAARVRGPRDRRRHPDLPAWRRLRQRLFSRVALDLPTPG